MGNSCQSKPKSKDIHTDRGTIILSSGGFDYSQKLYKILAIGESSVGKSSIVVRYADNTFEETHISTIGVDFKQKVVNLNGGNYKLQIWDTAGQERYRAISTTYYRDVKAVLVVYDVSVRSTYEKVERWMKEISQYAANDVVKVLVGNKIDLKRQVTTHDGEELAKRFEALFIETSAKDGRNIEECFNRVLKEIISRESQ